MYMYMYLSFTLVLLKGIICCFLYAEELLKKSRTELFDRGVANDMSKVTHDRIDTMFLFC